jgi:hypothetical protein
MRQLGLKIPPDEREFPDAPPPKFSVGQRVRYRCDRRTRRTITARYFDPKEKTWRYKVDENLSRKGLRDLWAPIESSLEAVE